jgi:lysophospholipase L1-like esterase
MIARARAAGLRTVGVTLLPMGGSVFSSPRSEAKRTAINTWLREAGSAGSAGNAGNYDAVIDLAEAMDTGGALTPAYDSGDHIHPNDTGYEAMAAATDLALL